MGHGAPRHDEVATQPVEVVGGAQRRDADHGAVGQVDRPDAVPCVAEPPRQRLVAVGVVGREGPGVRLVGQPAAHHLHAGGRVAVGGDLDGETEPVEQLGAQVALLGVHRADEDEACGVRHGDALPLDPGAPHGGCVEQRVDEVVGQEVDLVDVEDASVGPGEEAGVEGHATGGDQPVEVERADEAVLARADGELHEAHRPLHRGARPRGQARVRRIRAPRVGGERVAAEPAPLDHAHGWQDRCEAAHHRRLRRALLTAHEDTADGRGDDGEAQRQGQVVHADDRREGIAHRVVVHRAPPSRSPSTSR